MITLLAQHLGAGTWLGSCWQSIEPREHSWWVTFKIQVYKEHMTS